MSSEKQTHYDHDEVVRSDRGRGDEFGDVVSRRIDRRGFLKSGLVASIAATSVGKALGQAAGAPGAAEGLDFRPIAPSTAKGLALSPGYGYQVVLSWGDRLDTGKPSDVAKLTGAEQAVSFGYNNDFVAYLPLPFGSDSSDHGLLAVNHEYVNPELMFPVEDVTAIDRSQAEVSMEAVGFSVSEIKREGGKWKLVPGGNFNKRYSATSPMRISGPAKGDARLKTSAHRDGTTCTGTFSNCSGGTTPWGTVLSGEENFQDLFGHAEYTSEKDKRSAERYGVGSGASQYGWEKHVDRFNSAIEPNEPYHFGWVVEIDPFDPDWVPVKRTALGRFRHEAATTHVAKGGQVVMYSGDDSRFEYVYKFVSANRFNAKDRKANRDLMDNGTLYVARFDEDGTGQWLPLVYGTGPLTADNGFHSQADVVVDARIAADLLGATKMDRPEDIEVNPVNERVYIVCTNNTDRGKEGKEGKTKSNPRNSNQHGHIVELIEEGNDHASQNFKWDLFLVCGNPGDESTYYAGFPKEGVSPISCPDNICFDRHGNLWIATDGQEKTLKLRDGFFAVPTEGPERGKLRQFMASVMGSEVCGPAFTPDGTTAFLAIQHPDEGGKFGAFENSWPEPGKPSRPSIVAIQADNGAPIGSPEANAVSRRNVIAGILGR
ncbi:MAG: PhoX family phosphatase [Armatimonadetes bacterium]|nr:PhoX family phosphatase [Armatimonadota bacterium]